MALIDVNPGDLLTAAGRVENVLPASRSLVARLQTSTSTAAVGRADAANAIDTFLGRWRTGLSHLNADAEHLATLLRKAGEVYEAADRAVAQAASP